MDNAEPPKVDLNGNSGNQQLSKGEEVYYFRKTVIFYQNSLFFSGF